MGICDKQFTVGLIKQRALAPPLSSAQTQIHQSHTHFIPAHTIHMSKCQRLAIPQWQTGTLNLIWFINYSCDYSYRLVCGLKALLRFITQPFVFAFVGEGKSLNWTWPFVWSSGNVFLIFSTKPVKCLLLVLPMTLGRRAFSKSQLATLFLLCSLINIIGLHTTQILLLWMQTAHTID